MPFEPTLRQVEFRDLARHAYDDEHPRRMVSQWCNESRAGLMDEPVNIKEWRAWKEGEGFLDWFCELIPEMGGATLEDLKMTESTFYEGLNRGMLSGDPKALGVYPRIQVQQSARGMESEEADTTKWVNEGDGSAWRK